jgi:hypothetical protein
LPLGDAPADDAPLRAAFARLDLERVCKMTFEQFVADRTRRKSLANVIEARLRSLAEKSQHSERSTQHSREPA